MAISKNILIAFMATMVSFCVHSEDQQPKNPETAQLDLAEYLQAGSKIYKKYAQKIEPWCNPISLAGTAIASAFLGVKRMGIVALGTIVIVNSPAIKKQIEEYSDLKQEKISQDPKQELGSVEFLKR